MTEKGPATGVTLTIDGRSVTVPKGTPLIQAAHQVNRELPHFCYHPGLSIAGNCRMCMVEIEVGGKPMPKPQVACATLCTEGMVVKTDSPMARDARAGVMEFELINHPLDCPECDQAGECRLQDYSFEHGRGHGRIDPEQKNLRHIKDLGPHVKLWGTRCIVCTRCVRFLNEISGTGEIEVVNRGDRNVVDIFPGHPVENELSGNVVDVCPVGALVSTEFLYQARSWFLEKTRGVCPLCARACPTRVDTLEGQIKRVVAREIESEDQYFICDRGRLQQTFQQSSDRLREARVAGRPASGGEALEAALAVLRGAEPKGARVIGTAFNSVETLFLLRKLSAKLGGALAVTTRPDWARAVFPGFEIHADANPNRAGARVIVGAETIGPDGPAYQGLLAELERGAVQAALFVADLPPGPPGSPGAYDPRLLKALDRVPRRIVLATH